MEVDMGHEEPTIAVVSRAQGSPFGGDVGVWLCVEGITRTA